MKPNRSSFKSLATFLVFLLIGHSVSYALTSWTNPALVRDPYEEEKREAGVIAQKLTVPLAAPADKPTMAKEYLEGGYGKRGYGVPKGAAIDGSHAIEGSQGYFAVKAAFINTVNAMRNFFQRRNKLLARSGKKIKLILKPSIGGQHTPAQGIADGFQLVDAETGAVFWGTYELGVNYEEAISAVLKQVGADWDEIAVIPSSKSGSTDETMMIFVEIFSVLLKHVALKENLDGEAIAAATLDTMHAINFPNGNERPSGDLFKGFGIEAIRKTLQERKVKGSKAALKKILGNVLGNMFFETTDVPAESRLSAFIRNSELQNELLRRDIPGFGGVFHNVGGRWTDMLHMMTSLAQDPDLDPEVYWKERYQGVLKVREGDHEGVRLGNALLDQEIRDYALVVPKDFFWFGKALDQNFNESIWQFIEKGVSPTLHVISEEHWESQKHLYANQTDKMVIDLAGLKLPSAQYRLASFDSPVNLNGIENKQNLLRTYARLFTTFYAVTRTVGTRLIARALHEAGYRADAVDLNDLDNSATQIVQKNLYLRQAFVELGKKALDKRLDKLQAMQKTWEAESPETRENKSPVQQAEQSLQQQAVRGQWQTNLSGLSLEENLNSKLVLEEAFLQVLRLAGKSNKEFLPSYYLHGGEFVDLRESTFSRGLDVMQGTGDQHIRFQRVQAQREKKEPILSEAERSRRDLFLPFIISFVPDELIPGHPAVGFAKGQLHNISPNLVRDYFAEETYKVFVSETPKEEVALLPGEAFFLRLPEASKDMVKEALEAAVQRYKEESIALQPMDEKRLPLPTATTLQSA